MSFRIRRYLPGHFLPTQSTLLRFVYFFSNSPNPLMFIEPHFHLKSSQIEQSETGMRHNATAYQRSSWTVSGVKRRQLLPLLSQPVSIMFVSSSAVTSVRGKGSSPARCSFTSRSSIRWTDNYLSPPVFTVYQAITRRVPENSQESIVGYLPSAFYNSTIYFHILFVSLSTS